MATGTLGRLRQITTVVAKHGLAQYLGRGKGDSTAEPEADLDARRAGESEGAHNGAGSDDAMPTDPVQRAATIPASARRFRAILEDLGPTFIKFGQVLSTRADLLPPGFADALTGLQDDCPPMSPADTRAALRAGLGKRVEDVFAEFEDKPIASASIAQVHRARTKGGDEVAVKVQRLGIRDQIVGDLDVLRYLAQLAEAIVEESGLVTPRGVVEEFEAALLAELDFTREADNMRRFRANLEGKERTYVIPRVYDELSSRTVLTMELVRGRRTSSVTGDEAKRAVAANIVHASFAQIFEDGLFHADPHPGNAFILDDNRLALIDFGSVGSISYAMRETLVVLVIAVGLRDADTAARLLYRVGIPDERVSLHALRDACASLFHQYLCDRATVASADAAMLLKELFELASRFRIRLPSEYALITRAAITIEGVIRQLDPQLQVLEIAKPYVKRLVDEQLAIAELGDNAMRNLVRARGFMRDLPLAASQILMDLEAGKLRVQIENPKLDTIARNIDTLGLIVFLGLIGSGLVTGSLIYLSRYDWELWGVPILPTAALYLASIFLGTAIGRYVFAPRMRKLSVGRWLRGRRAR